MKKQFNKISNIFPNSFQNLFKQFSNKLHKFSKSLQAQRTSSFQTVSKIFSKSFQHVSISFQTVFKQFQHVSKTFSKQVFEGFQTQFCKSVFKQHQATFLNVSKPLSNFFFKRFSNQFSISFQTNFQTFSNIQVALILS